ncbi:MAG: hypothetical protein H0V48_07055 [Nocardioidaceae bacterium]|nr:hypothetical protein [Nocardioidaceae bacterium]
MRWDDVFADLEADAAGLEGRERDAEIADRTRGELARITLADRFRAALGRTVSVRVVGVGVLEGAVTRIAAPWLLLETAGASEWLVAWPAVVSASGLPRQAVSAPPRQVAAALGWPATWRVLARDRATVHVVRHDASTLTAVPERAGSDFVELRTGSAAAATVELVPYNAVMAVRCPRER